MSCQHFLDTYVHTMYRKISSSSWPTTIFVIFDELPLQLAHVGAVLHSSLKVEIFLSCEKHFYMESPQENPGKERNPSFYIQLQFLFISGKNTSSTVYVTELSVRNGARNKYKLMGFMVYF